MSELKPVVRKKSSKSFVKPTGAPPPVKPTYDVPKWAGKPPQGMHLDVMKEGKLIEKFIVDGKTHFFFGRQREFIDFTIDHTSCSRVHAVMVYHKHLNRMFLIDLGSTHGTFQGHIRLEAHRPMQLPVDDLFSFGASTRTWMLREKPTMPSAGFGDTSLNNSLNDSKEVDSSNVSLLGLPEAENELQDLTEFNTAHNRRLATLPIDDANPLLTRKRRRSSHNVSFTEEEEVINPGTEHDLNICDFRQENGTSQNVDVKEDIDPTIGRFRNLASTTIIVPNKKTKTNPSTDKPAVDAHVTKNQQEFHTNNLYNDVTQDNHNITNSISLLPKISSAPDVDAPTIEFKRPVAIPQYAPATVETVEQRGPQEPAKKKYHKEAWPGRKPGKSSGQNLLTAD